MDPRAAESFVFHRPLGRALPVIAHGSGAELWDTDGKRYLDGSGGAVVVNVGHGRRRSPRPWPGRPSAVAYVHGTQFTSGPSRSTRAGWRHTFPATATACTSSRAAPKPTRPQ